MALRCPAEAEQLEALLPDVPLFVGQRQRWLVALKLGAEGDAQSMVRAAFQAWLPLLGQIGEPEVVEELEGTPENVDAIAIAPDELPTPSPTRWVVVEFDFVGRGAATSRPRWPTWVQQRRARVRETCPVPPLAALPVAVLEPSGLLGDDMLPPRQGLRDPVDAGVGPISPPSPLQVGAIVALVAGIWLLGKFASAPRRL